MDAESLREKKNARGGISQIGIINHPREN